MRSLPAVSCGQSQVILWSLTLPVSQDNWDNKSRVKTGAARWMADVTGTGEMTYLGKHLPWQQRGNHTLHKQNSIRQQLWHKMEDSSKCILQRYWMPGLAIHYWYSPFHGRHLFSLISVWKNWGGDISAPGSYIHVYVEPEMSQNGRPWRSLWPNKLIKRLSTTKLSDQVRLVLRTLPN